MLVVAMVMGMSMTTMAAETVVTTAEGKFEKTYTGSDVYPGETVEFEVTNKTDNAPTLLVGTKKDNKELITAKTTEVPFEVTLNNTAPGIYVYEITEKAGNTQGVTDYATGQKIEVRLLVVYVNGNTPSIAEFGVTDTNGDDDGGKNDVFTNTYKVGSLKVTKNVSGNLANKVEEFEIHVTFSSNTPVLSDIGNGPSVSDWSKEANATEWTATTTIHLADTEDYTFTNIPAGVTYSVKEDAKHGLGTDGFNTNSDDMTDYTVTYDGDLAKDAATGTISEDNTSSATVLNEKSTTIDTGLIINNFPYILALAAVALVAVAFMRKRRSF